MIVKIQLPSKIVEVDLSKPLDISIPLRAGKINVNAWNADPMRIEAVRIGDWVGDVAQGGSVNFRNIFFNPHGNGTHTECVGHISKENFTINQCLKDFFFSGELISIEPELQPNGDRMLTYEQLKEKKFGSPEALLIRTLPNDDSKINRKYSGTNPAFIHHQAAEYIRTSGIKHLLIDLPSVDRERDEGKLLGHRAFWNYPSDTRKGATITEMIYVPDSIPDGNYFVNIQIASFENDASPSKILLFKLK